MSVVPQLLLVDRKKKNESDEGERKKNRVVSLVFFAWLIPCVCLSPSLPFSSFCRSLSLFSFFLLSFDSFFLNSIEEANHCRALCLVFFLPISLSLSLLLRRLFTHIYIDLFCRSFSFSPSYFAWQEK